MRTTRQATPATQHASIGRSPSTGKMPVPPAGSSITPPLRQLLSHLGRQDTIKRYWKVNYRFA